MGTLILQPSLSELYGFISSVKQYPVSVRQLLKLAGEVNAPGPVMEFYKSFRPEQTFKNQDELTGLSEQVGILRLEEDEMPRELERATEEY